MKARNIFIAIVIVIILLIWFKGCYNVDITKKPTTKDLVIQVLERLGLVETKVDTLAARIDERCGDHNKKIDAPTGRRTIIYRETVREIPAGRQSDQDYYSAPAQTTEQPQTQRTTPQTGTITPGSNNPGPQDLLFCIDLEPSKSSDTSKKFLFWELVNGLGYSISNVVPNFTGRSANMSLTPGASVDGISFDGSMLKMSITSFGNWYAQIMGVPMPDNFRPALRSNKSGWSSRLMTRSGDYFVYRF